MKSVKASKKSISIANEEVAATESVLDKAVKAVEKKAAKKATKKAETAEKEEELTTARKKSSEKESSKKESKKTVEAKVIFQFLGNEIEPKNLLEQAKADYLASGGKEKDIKAMELYIKPEDNAAYYVVNGVPYGKVAIFA